MPTIGERASNFFLGQQGGFEQLPLYGEQQQGGFNQALQMALSGLQGPLGQGFTPIAEQAQRRYQEQTVPGILERVSAQGGRGSSGLGHILGQYGSRLQEDLAAQQAKFGLDERQQLMSLLGIGLTPQFQNIYRPDSPGLFQGLAGGIGQGFGSYLGSGGNPLAALMGLFGGLGGSQQQGQQQQSIMPNLGANVGVGFGQQFPSFGVKNPYLRGLF